MANNKNEAVVIRKKVNGGHAAAHGGAWKVAYADFITAMMCFFLVMWLMGSDEETKKAISEYFNNPQGLLFGGSDRPSDRNSRNPGNDQSILSGQQGRYEEEAMTKPSKPSPVYLEEHKILSEMVSEIFEGSAFSVDANSEYVKFSVPGHVIFQSGSSKLSYQGQRYLSKLATVFKQYEGNVTIEGHTDKPEKEGTSDSDIWKLSFDRAISVRDYLIAEEHVRAEKLIPVAQGSRYPASTTNDPEDLQKNRRVEFILKHTR